MIISISGLIGSGKDTVAEILVKEYGFKRESWAGNLKDAVSSIFGWDRQNLEGITDDSRLWRDQVDTWWTERLGFEVVPRKILQNFGTNICRDNFHNDIWVASLEHKLLNTTENIVITDTRFQNEFESVKKLGGYTWRIIRGLEPEWVTTYKQLDNKDKFKELYPNIHPSEYSSVGLNYDMIVYNNTSIRKLTEKVINLVESHLEPK